MRELLVRFVTMFFFLLIVCFFIMVFFFLPKSGKIIEGDLSLHTEPTKHSVSIVPIEPKTRR